MSAKQYLKDLGVFDTIYLKQPKETSNMSKIMEAYSELQNKKLKNVIEIDRQSLIEKDAKNNELVDALNKMKNK